MEQRLLIAVASVCMAAAAHAAVPDYPPPPGKAHPDFALPSIVDGRAVSLAQFRGKKVLLMHFASW